MKTHYITPLFLAIFLFGACSESKTSSEKNLDDCPVVATIQKVGNDHVTTLHLDRVKDTLDLPVSQLLEDFRIIQLDNRDEALIKREFVSAYDNYICTGGTSQEPCKLFDKAGRFLCQIGANGQGPGEYWAVYDDYVDEANNRIYLMPWNARAVLVYDLNGKFISDIPLPVFTPKGVFAIDTQKQLLTVGLLPINEIEGIPIVWQQDFKGNILHSVEAAPYAFKGDYSSEVSSYGNIRGIFDFSILSWEPMADTFYYFIPEENRLAPVMTLQQPEEKISHDYMELPNHYIIDLPTGNSPIGIRSNVIIDKKTQKGAYVRILNDLIGNKPIEKSIFHFKNGYFAYTMDPGNLLDNIETALSHPDRLREELLTQLKTLQKSVDANDNNYLFIGKIKSDTENVKLNASTNPVETQPEKTKTQQVEPQQTTAVLAETDSIYDLPHNTAHISNYESYLKQNNKFYNWDISQRKVVAIKAVVEKDGSVSEAHRLWGADYNKEKNQFTNRNKTGCGIQELDEEAIRLIREATFIPGKNKDKNPVRSRITTFVFFPPL